MCRLYLYISIENLNDEQHRRTGELSIPFLFDENPSVTSAGLGAARNITRSDRATSQKIQRFPARESRFPSLPGQFRRQIGARKFHSLRAAHTPRRPSRVRDARLFICQARHQSTRSFLIPINVLNGPPTTGSGALNSLNGVKRLNVFYLTIA